MTSKQTKIAPPLFQAMKRLLVPTGHESIGFSISFAAKWLLRHYGILRSYAPQSRNEVIRARFADGESLSDLAAIYEVSPQRIFQIVNVMNH